jgi:hypothetical protein
VIINSPFVVDEQRLNAKFCRPSGPKILENTALEVLKSGQVFKFNLK